MKTVDRWLLPDGIEELLPIQAAFTEKMRRKLVDLFRQWGYDYVTPPMVEFTDSLLTGSGSDIDLLTFKMTDQLSGKMMGVRADITPQVARMDAHSLQREGVSRLCYAGHVMHTRPKAQLASRTPLKVGVELFGEAGVDADVEVVSLMIEALKSVDLPKQYVDLGHVGIFRALAEFAELSSEAENQFFSLLQAKAVVDIQRWVEENIADPQLQAWFLALPSLSGGMNVFVTAREVFAEAPAEVSAAIDELETVAQQVANRYPQAQLFFDLGELRGYHYHTGIVFGAYSPGVGTAIASGGRYDHIGESFGRARPATGFDVDISSICRLQSDEAAADLIERSTGIFVASTESDTAWSAAQSLRSQGERVVLGLSGQIEPAEFQRCDRVLVKVNGEYQVQPLTNA